MHVALFCQVSTSFAHCGMYNPITPPPNPLCRTGEVLFYCCWGNYGDSVFPFLCPDLQQKLPGLWRCPYMNSSKAFAPALIHLSSLLPLLHMETQAKQSITHYIHHLGAQVIRLPPLKGSHVPLVCSSTMGISWLGKKWMKPVSVPHLQELS